MAAPLHYASASIDRPVGPTPNWCYQSGAPAREICSATFCFPARRAWYVAVDRLGDSYCQSRIDVAFAHSFLEQHSGLGGSASGHRNDGERRLVCVAWPFYRYGHLGLHWSNLRVRRWRFSEALGFFVGMKSIFIVVLTGRTAASAKQLLSGPYLGSGILFTALPIRPS